MLAFQVFSRTTALQARGRQFLVAAFSMLLLASARPATATQNEAEERDQPTDAAAVEYSSHAVALAKQQHWKETGFTISPNQLFDRFAGFGADVQQDARMHELYSENPTLWKRVAWDLSKEYARMQKDVNHQQFAVIERYRSEVSRTLTRLVRIRGGGSESAILNALTPAETEWILKQMAVSHAEPISDHDFESALQRDIGNDRAAATALIKQALAELEHVERGMSPQQVASERHEIIEFFRMED